MKKIFSYNEDIQKTAYLNWRVNPHDNCGNMEALAKAYFSTSRYLMEIVLSDNTDKKADSLIFPILYSIDQGIELYLKAIIQEIETLTLARINNYDTHDINSLYNNMCAQMKKKEKITKGLQKHLEPVKTYIDELYSIIYVKKEDGKTKLNIDFARYPYNTEGESHFYVCNTNVVVDIPNLLSRLQEIENSLESLYALYEAEIDGLRSYR